ncbi:MAG: RNA-binding cell elongation regulator Jag/EloR [Acidimicrobiia bacterium]
MEWVEVTATTVDEAKDRALDQLGVDESDAEFEILEEPRPGLFGRMRGEARVRARVRPTTPRPKAERRERRKPAAKTDKVEKADSADKPDKADKAEKTAKSSEKAASKPARAPRATKSAAAVEATDAPAKPARAKSGGRTKAAASEDGDAMTPTDTDPDPGHEAERDSTEPEVLGAAVVEFLDGLVEAFGADGTAEYDVIDGDLEAHVDGNDLGLLIGPQGNTLQAIQELTRLATQRSTSDRSVRIRLDIGQYRERRREALVRFTNQVAEQVISSGSARSLEPMPAADRKVVHDAAQLIGGVVTSSEGEEPRRRVVIKPA